MLRIRRLTDKSSVTFALSGRIEETHVPDLEELLENEPTTTGLAIDLAEVRLVDRQVVKFLSACETKGILLKNCPSYVREWIELGSEEKGSAEDN